MKRPLALVGFTYLLTQAVSVFIGAANALVLGAICLLIGLLLLLLHKGGKALPTAAFTAVCACVLFFFGSLPFSRAAGYAGSTVRLSGVVSDAPDYSGRHPKYLLKVETCGGKSDTPLTGKKIQFTSDANFSAEQFDRVTASFRLRKPTGDDYFSRKNGLLADGVVLQGYLNDFMPSKIQAGSPPLLQKIPYLIRRKLLEYFSDDLPSPENSLVSGVLVGEKQAVPDAVSDAFRGAGVSHLMSVSGLHMSTVAQFMLLLLGLLPIPKRTRMVLAQAGVLLFMSITCFTPSVVRSGIMYLLLLGAGCFRRKASSLNSLGMSVLLICLLNPYAAADISLLLSFSATLGMMVCMKPAKILLNGIKRFPRLPRKLLEYVLGTILTSLTAMLFTLPVTLCVFNEISLVSPLANLLVITPSSWMIYAGFGAALLSLFPVLSPVAGLLWHITDALADWLIASTQWCSGLPPARVPTDCRFVLLWLACTLLLLGAMCILCRRHRKLPLMLTAMLSAVLFLMNLLLYQVDAQKLKVTVAASGEGVSVVVSSAGHGAVIGFGAESWQTEHILRRCGVHRLDTIVLLSLSNRECQQAAKVAADWHPASVVLPAGTVLDGALEDVLTANHVQCFPAGTQAQASLWQQVLITCENGAANLKLKNLSLLICGDNANLADIPPELQGAQIMVCSGLPKNDTAVHTTMTVLCDYSHSLKKKYVVNSRGLPAVLGGGKDLVLEPCRDTVRIRRND
ncbi:MAG: ComEC/Rec2 family competence protein [Oscillospiraceae bacterium]|jgi:competence protein ComEC|nr:ComEC/Rec2 family competence protein [Oscillospiraceae bacterium]